MPAEPDPLNPSRPSAAPKRVNKRVRSEHRGGRSEIYGWLYRHYASVSKALAERDTSWQCLAATMAADDVIGWKGAPPTANAVLKVWARVSRDVEAKRQARQTSTSGRRFPAPPPTLQAARSPARPADGRGPPLAPLNNQNPASSLARPADPMLPVGDLSQVVNNVNSTPEEQLAGLRRILDHRSGR